MGKKSRRKKQNIWKKIKDSYKYLRISWIVQTREFFENSTLHGVKYIAATDRPFIERFMWFVCVTTGTVAAVVIIFSLWEKFQTNPTITGLDTDFHNWQVPFPAITVCPEHPTSMDKINNLLGITENSSSDENQKASFLYDFSQLTFKTLPGFVEKYSENVPHFEKDEDIRSTMIKFMSNCSELFNLCTFKDTDYTCCDLFHPVFTPNGFCHSFNSRHYERTDQSSAQPNMQYIRETDLKWSLEFSLNSKEVVTPIYIVNSDELIGIDIQPQHIWDFKVYRISFSIKQTYTTEDTRQLSIKQRRCVFEDEIKLEVDHIYTYTACTIQCRMENARSLCGCVPFFYPRTSSFPYCTLDKLSCMAKNLDKIQNIDRCDCQLGCKNTVYEVEAQNQLTEGTTDQMETGFVSWPMARYKREVLFGWVDLLVSFGGIAGLFLGFSLLSGVEIFYYFIIRAVIASFRERRDLDRYLKEHEEKSKPPYDLSLVPYFVSDPLPGEGIDEIAKRYRAKRFGLQIGKRNKIKPWKQSKNLDRWAVPGRIVPPYGIEFIN